MRVASVLGADLLLVLAVFSVVERRVENPSSQQRTAHGAHLPWDNCGHKIIATLALEQLKPEALKAVETVFKNDPRKRHFVDAAVWPDDIKRGHRNSPPKAPVNKPWHYVDIPYDATEKEIQRALNHDGKKVDPADPDSANVVTAIRYFTTLLKAGGQTPQDEADALSWLIHLVGDIHQPLHCVTVTGKLPNYAPPINGGDRGGNGFAIDHPARELHALWDDLFDEPSGQEGHGGRNDTDDNAADLADHLKTLYEAEKVVTAHALGKHDPADWARESYRLREFVYEPELSTAPGAGSDVHALTDEDLKRARSIADKRVPIAGARLARLLNSIYGGV